MLVRLGGTNARVPTEISRHVAGNDELFVTPLSRAEIAIKVGTGKLRLSAPESEFWEEVVRRLQAVELPFTSAHAALLSSLPPYHRDPFDRMIIAQALCEDLVIATTDEIFNRYGVRTIL